MHQNRDNMTHYAHQYGLDDYQEFDRFPKFVQIETVAVCNARCVMCPVEEWERNAQLMSDELFNKMAKELKRYKNWVERVTTQLDGEPLIDKKLEDKIHALKKIGMRYVNFNSNSSLMTKSRAKSILESGVDEVSFSIDGASKETFEKIRRRLNYEQCIANIERFVQMRNQMRPEVIVRIRMTIQQENAHEYQDFLQFWRERLGSQDLAYGKLIHNWANWREDYEIPYNHVEQSELNASPCISPFTSMIVFADGRVPLCCIDYNAQVEFGNVNQNSIQEVWQSESFRKVRADHIEKGRNSMPMCKDCNVWDMLAKKTTSQKISI